MDTRLLVRVALAALLAALQEIKPSLTGVLGYAADLAINFIKQLLGNTPALEEVAATLASLQTRHGLTFGK